MKNIDIQTQRQRHSQHSKSDRIIIEPLTSRNQRSTNFSNLLDQKQLRNNAINGKNLFISQQDAKMLFKSDLDSKFTDRKKSLIQMSIKQQKTFYNTLYFAQTDLVQQEETNFTLPPNPTQINFQSIKDSLESEFKVKKINPPVKQKKINSPDFQWLQKLISPREDVNQIRVWLIHKMDQLQGKQENPVNYLDEELNILQTAMQEMVRQVQNDCKERGHLLKYIWQGILDGLEINNSEYRIFENFECKDRNSYEYWLQNKENGEYLHNQLKTTIENNQNLNDVIQDLSKQINYFQQRDKKQQIYMQMKEKQSGILSQKITELSKELIPLYTLQETSNQSLHQIILQKHTEFMEKWKNNSFSSRSVKEKEVVQTIQVILKQFEQHIQNQIEIVSQQKESVIDNFTNTDLITNTNECIQVEIKIDQFEKTTQSHILMLDEQCQHLCITLEKQCECDIKIEQMNEYCQTIEEEVNI